VSFPAYIGKKRGMTQVFTEDGSAVAVTVVELLPLTVTQIKTLEQDGYPAVQVGYLDAKAKHLTKPQQQHLRKNNLKLFRRLKEFRVSADSLDQFSVGDEIDNLSALAPGQGINITGHSIGKGFQGNTARWGHGRGPMSHGSKSHRLPGSIGAGTTPGRVFKGLKMAGKTGNGTVTVKNVKVVRVIPEKRILLVKGSVPGVEGGLLVIKARPARNG
jgi:large subunit ribosomal protein L3